MSQSFSSIDCLYFCVNYHYPCDPDDSDEDHQDPDEVFHPPGDNSGNGSMRRWR